jgi:hypothetical protein
VPSRGGEPWRVRAGPSHWFSCWSSVAPSGSLRRALVSRCSAFLSVWPCGNTAAARATADISVTSFPPGPGPDRPGRREERRRSRQDGHRRTAVALRGPRLLRGRRHDAASCRVGAKPRVDRGRLLGGRPPAAPERHARRLKGPAVASCDRRSRRRPARDQEESRVEPVDPDRTGERARLRRVRYIGGRTTKRAGRSLSGRGAARPRPSRWPQRPACAFRRSR